jgi:hypothetical protein
MLHNCGVDTRRLRRHRLQLPHRLMRFRTPMFFASTISSTIISQTSRRISFRFGLVRILRISPGHASNCWPRLHINSAQPRGKRRQTARSRLLFISRPVSTLEITMNLWRNSRDAISMPLRPLGYSIMLALQRYIRIHVFLTSSNIALSFAS